MYKGKLTEILKEVSENKKDLEELRFGCEIICDEWFAWTIIREWTEDWEDLWVSHCWYLIDFNWYSALQEYDTDDIKDLKIIWNPIQERNLRMYCESKKKYFTISTAWYIVFENTEKWIRLDNNKDFSNQSEEVYKSIVEFLESNK